MVGFTGRIIGGGLGTGRLVSTRRSCFWTLCCFVGEALRCWGMRSTTIPRMLLWEGGGMMPRVIRMSRSPTLIAIARAKPDARRWSGVRS